MGTFVFSVLFGVSAVMMNWTSFCCIAILPFLIDTGHTKALAGIEVPPPEILRFLRRFGYLMPIPINGVDNAETLYHETAIVEAIKNVQKYGAINQTGVLDNETLELFTKPRCGVPDIEGTPYYLLSSTTANPLTRRKRYVIGAQPWKKRNISYFIANWSLKMRRDQVERDIARAFRLWSQYSGLRFQRVNTTAADIIVGFGSRYHGDNYPFDGTGNILAHAFYPYEMGSWGGDLHFDEDENWSVNFTGAGGQVDFYSVAVHELGHSLGLAHSPVYDSIMFPYYKGSGATALAYDDTLAMYDMYLSKQLEDNDEGEKTLDKNLDNEEDNGNDEEDKREESRKDPDPEEVPGSTSEPITVEPTFRGDFSTVTEHKTRYATNLTPSLTEDTVPTLRPTRILTQIPDICRGSFDAVTTMNGSVYIFKQAYLWKLSPQYTVEMGYPRSIYEQFPFLPAEVKRIDAAYERYDGAMVFFTGTSYWVFNSSMMALENSPQNLTNYLGSHYEKGPDKLDAAMLWPKNNCTYLFVGSLFWRYNDTTRTLDDGYPKSMRRWPGIPNHVNAAATLTNGKTYFFKDNLYWLYDNAKVRPSRGYPRRASTAWLGCALPTKTPLRNYNTTVSFISSLASA